MTTSVAQIAKEAFDGVASGVSGVVQAATLTETVQGAYDPATGAYAVTENTFQGRVIVGDPVTSAQEKQTAYAGYTAGPNDLIMYLEGFAKKPKIGWKVTFGGRDYELKFVNDVSLQGQFFEVVAA